MARDLLIPTEIIVCDTVRESDGLAMSSRNRYLSPKEREMAPILYLGLSAAKSKFDRGEVSASELIKTAKDIISKENVTLQYLSVASALNLHELDKVGKEGALMSGAILVGSTRIIDNMMLL